MVAEHAAGRRIGVHDVKLCVKHQHAGCVALKQAVATRFRLPQRLFSLHQRCDDDRHARLGDDATLRIPFKRPHVGLYPLVAALFAQHPHPQGPHLVAAALHHHPVSLLELRDIIWMDDTEPPTLALLDLARFVTVEAGHMLMAQDKFLFAVIVEVKSLLRGVQQHASKFFQPHGLLFQLTQLLQADAQLGFGWARRL